MLSRLFFLLTFAFILRSISWILLAKKIKTEPIFMCKQCAVQTHSAVIPAVRFDDGNEAE